jgi:hypothetical protein
MGVSAAVDAPVRVTDIKAAAREPPCYRRTLLRGDFTMVRKALSSRMLTLRRLTERASNDPQRMRARKIETEIMEKMPSGTWLSGTSVSRLISSSDDRKTAHGLIACCATASSNASASRAATARSICSGDFVSKGPPLDPDALAEGVSCQHR